MAFTLNTFQFGRGVATCPVNGNGVSTVYHYYKSEDTYATITTGGYFPNNIDNSEVSDKIFIGDLITIVASDNTGIVRITEVSPFTIGSNLLGTAGSPITIATPIAATDANGLTISGTTLRGEIADATHPGIITIGDQAFSGIKLFMSGTQFLTSGGSASTLNHYEETTHATTFTLGTETTASITFKVTRIGRLVNITSTTTASTIAQGAPGVAYVANTALPARFRPAQAMSNSYQVQNATILSNGLISIATNGIISIYNNPDKTTAFTTAQINGFEEGAINYAV